MGGGVAKFRAFVTGALVFFFGVGILNRILNDKSAPGLLKDFFDSMSGLFSNTING